MSMAEDELGRRVERLESQPDPQTGLPAEVRSAREDAAAARHLAAANDRDVADLHTELRAFRQATNASFNAMRADFADLRTEFGDLRTEVRATLAQSAAGQQQIMGMLTTLIEQDRPHGD